MATPLISLSVKGTKALQTALKQRISRLESFAVPLKAIAQDFYDTEAAWFKSKGGGRWKPLSPGYAAWKNRTHPGKPIMQLSGRMWREFTGKPGHVIVTKNRLRIWIVGADYWKEHQTGVRWKNLPKRQILAVTLRQHRPRWHKMVTEWLTSKLDLTPQKLVTFGKK